MGTKLVRDSIQYVDGYVPCSSDHFRMVRSSNEHRALLIKKIHEELGELLEADAIGYSNEINEEGCDLAQVLFDFIFVRTAMTREELLRRMDQKHKDRGGFSSGVVWEHP